VEEKASTQTLRQGDDIPGKKEKKREEGGTPVGEEKEQQGGESGAKQGHTSQELGVHRSQNKNNPWGRPSRATSTGSRRTESSGGKVSSQHLRVS